MSEIPAIQREHAAWMEYNFPRREPYYHVLGLIGELGELAQAMLKILEGIGYRESHERAIADGIGDIAIFLMGLCTDLGIDFERLLIETWNEVSERDWVTYPKNGRTE